MRRKEEGNSEAKRSDEKRRKDKRVEERERETMFQVCIVLGAKH